LYYANFPNFKHFRLCKFAKLRACPTLALKKNIAPYWTRKAGL